MPPKRGSKSFILGNLNQFCLQIITNSSIGTSPKPVKKTTTKAFACSPIFLSKKKRASYEKELKIEDQTMLKIHFGFKNGSLQIII